MKAILNLIWILCFFCFSCGSSSTLVNKKPINVEWIVGKWKQKDAEIYEKWIKVSDMEFKGVGYDMTSGITNIKETMRIFRTGNGQWFYEATLMENNKVPVLFKWVPDPVITLKFVNDLHDYPQIIAYKLEAFDIMSATISNMSGDKRNVYDYSRYATQ